MGVEAKAWTLASLIKHYNWTAEFEEALDLCEELQALNQTLQSRYFDNFLLFQKGLIYTATGGVDKGGAFAEQRAGSLGSGR